MTTTLLSSNKEKGVFNPSKTLMEYLVLVLELRVLRSMRVTLHEDLWELVIT